MKSLHSKGLLYVDFVMYKLRIWEGVVKKIFIFKVVTSRPVVALNLLTMMRADLLNN